LPVERHVICGSYRRDGTGRLMTPRVNLPFNPA
jgi:hypothetical protein